MAMRLGRLLVQHGVLTEEQRETILLEQRVSHRPFGLLAEEIYGVDPRAVERAWAAQYASLAERVNPVEERPTSDALQVVEARQAWQFGLLPLRFEQDELVVVTTEDRLARALRFAGWRLPFQCRFLLCEEQQLAEALELHFPMAGITTETMQTLRLAVEG